MKPSRYSCGIINVPIMKKKILASVVGVAFATVMVVSLNCGCAFAEMAPQVTETQSAMADCDHETSSSQTSGDQARCCSSCQLQKIGQAPVSQHNINVLKNISPHILKQAMLLVFDSAQARTPKRHLGRFRSGLRAARVSSPESPLYLQLQSLLI
jgi:hypothetical protein